MPETSVPDAADIIAQLTYERREAIAIVGIGLRFPGGNDTLDGFAEFLRAGRSGIVPLPEDRWDLSTFRTGDTEAPGKIRAAAGGFLDRIDQFDAPFFNISPKEAHYVDPQQRLLLETAWEAIENANIDPATLRHRNGGVFIGASAIDYALELDSLPYEQLDPALATGMTIYPMAGRLSYFLGWRGPSLNTDTACAASLTALHLATDSLRRKECDIALVGAVNCIHHPRTLVMFSHGGMLAPDGHCKTFDDAADGYARAEGCGVLVVKRVSDAVRDGDTILALVRGTAIGQDGESAGLTVPNGTAQEEVMRTALTNAGLTPADIQYVEAHGTGTPLGDPIEMGSINGVYGTSHTKTDPLTVGSLKSNLGHMEPVAGIGGIVKTVLQMRDGQFYPHLYDTPSGRIPWDRIPVTVPTGGEPWDAPIRRAAVNSFGFAGAIGVAVLEQAPVQSTQPTPVVESTGESHVFTVSAKNRRALGRQLQRYQRFLAENADNHNADNHNADNPAVDIADLCYTTNVGRTHFSHRAAGVVRDRDDLDHLLEREIARVERTERVGDIRKVAFLCAGSGSQYVGMGQGLYHRFPVFRQHVDECDRLFARHLGRSVKDLMFGDAPDADRLHEVQYTQPALFTLEYALAQLWMSWGIKPNVMIGHSTGEVAAAAVAGLFSLADGVRFMAERARLIQSVTTPGGMAAVAAPVDAVVPLLDGYPDLAISAVNSPRQCVISGGRRALDKVVAVLRDRGHRVTPLAVSTAYHSPLMAEVAEPLRAVVAGITFHEPTISIVSNLTGQVARPAEISTPDYWVRHLMAAVDFESGMRAIERRGRHVFVELGPATNLTTPATQCVTAENHRWLNSLHPDDADGTSTIRRALGQIYVAGMPVTWPAVHAGRPRRTIALPNYVFERKRYWLPNDATRHGAARSSGATAHPLLGTDMSTPEQAAAGVREFGTRLSTTYPAYLAEHTANGRAFYPAAAYLETLLALQDAVYGETRRAIRDLQFRDMLFLPTETAVELRTRLCPNTDGTATVDILSRAANGVERCHATAVIGGPDGELTNTGRCMAEVPFTDVQAVFDADDIYAVYRKLGLDYGPAFRPVRKVTRHGDNLAVGELAGYPTSALEHLPPPLMDGATHAIAALLDGDRNFVAIRFGWFRLYKKPKGDTLRAVLRTRPGDDQTPGAEFCADVLLTDAGRPVFELHGVAFAPVTVVEPAVATVAVDRAALPGRSRQERLASIELLVRSKVAGVLRMDDVESVDATTEFVQLGLNSLVAVQLRSALETELGVALPPSVALDHPSAKQLAEFLDRCLVPEQAA
ncbi:MAG TPA: beta-ketoacyl synthase N-terminal-like domain-containing protein [Pseudonocardiaceae bacterium]|nr:beta-ketoacyl synthase N-terminal-like domain-containing protein [Pseudonocardiaceae bacterium]